jgi:hypothetical protein
MNDGNQQFSSKKRQRKHELIMASSKGGYLWSDRDLKNAMLWFISQDSVSDDDQSDTFCLRPMIESLLNSPGIFHNRPTRQTKRQRGEVKEEGPLLPQIISQCIKHSKMLDAEETDMENTNISIDWLQSALCDVATNRRLNEELFDNYQKICVQIISQQNKPGDGSRILHVRHLWNYLANPKTIIKSVYAAQIYDQFLKLTHQNKEGQDFTNKKRINLPPDAFSFLKKMHKLSKIQTDVAEVYLLVTMEPIKRKYSPSCNWIKKILNETKPDVDIDISDPIEKESFCHMSKSIIDTISERDVYKLPPALMCIVAKTYFPFAKTFIQKLISCAVLNYEAIPNFIVNQAILNDADRDKTHDNHTPKRDFDRCVDILSQLLATSGGMKSLCHDICDNYKSSFQSDIHIRALEEIVTVCFGKND